MLTKLLSKFEGVAAWKLYVAGGVIIAILLGLGVWYIRHTGVVAGRLEIQTAWDKFEKERKEAEDKKQAEDQAAADGAAAVAAARLQFLTQQNQIMQKRLANEKASNRVYIDCIVPDGGVRIYNEAAIPGANR